MGPKNVQSTVLTAEEEAAIVAFRKLLLTQARKLRDTGELSLPKQPELYRVRSVGIVLPRNVDLEEGARERMMVA